MAEVFDQSLSEEKIRIYIRVLGDLDIESLISAMGTVVSRHTRFPVPAVLRELAAEHRKRKQSGQAKRLTEATDIIPQEELRSLIGDLIAKFDERSYTVKSAPSRQNDEYASQLTAKELAKRREELRRQAKEIANV